MKHPCGDHALITYGPICLPSWTQPPPEMWVPRDINAIPSSEDLINATNAIDQVEDQLKEALLSLEQARLRVADLEKELEQRRAWISPIRRLNFDVLCRVFEFVGEDDWKAPLRLASVSQSWRATVLRTPRAWSFFDLRRKRNSMLTDLYLERSGQRLLHIGIRHTSFSTLVPMKDRLQCLSVYTFPASFGGVVFPHVTRLYIRYTDVGIFPTYFTRKHFPALRHLYCQSNFIREPTFRFDGDDDFTYDLPPLETLSLLVSSDPSWVRFIRSCSGTLTSLFLELRGIVTSSSQRESIAIPYLKCLQVSGRMVHVGIWPLHLKTPVLESYISHGGQSSTDRPIHSDLDTVQQMRLAGVRPLNNCCSLRYLQILNWNTVLYPILTMLEMNVALCPRLEVIIVAVHGRFRLEEDVEFTRRVADVQTKRTGLKVLREYGSMERLAGEMNRSVSQLDVTVAFGY
jgi:hypothetical protein